MIGEQPGTNEVSEGRPFVGKSGKELAAGLGGTHAFVTNVRKCLGRSDESKELRRASINHCTAAYLQDELDACTEARTVLVVGADALETIVGVTSTIKWHGAVLSREEAESIHEAHLRDGED